MITQKEWVEKEKAKGISEKDAWLNMWKKYPDLIPKGKVMPKTGKAKKYSLERRCMVYGGY